MRCISCNNILTTQEACSRFKSGTPTEMCTPCVRTTDMDVVIPERFKQQKQGESFAQEEYEGEYDPPPWEEISGGVKEDDEWVDS
jgi:hypothetical protein